MTIHTKMWFMFLMHWSSHSQLWLLPAHCSSLQDTMLLWAMTVCAVSVNSFSLKNWVSVSPTTFCKDAFPFSVINVSVLSLSLNLSHLFLSSNRLPIHLDLPDNYMPVALSVGQACWERYADWQAITPTESWNSPRTRLSAVLALGAGVELQVPHQRCFHHNNRPFPPLHHHEQHEHLWDYPPPTIDIPFPMRLSQSQSVYPGWHPSL